MYIKKKDLLLPKRKSDSIKGDNGKILIIGGSENYVGAPALAGLAALRVGVDWVTIYTPEKVGWAINSISPDLIVKKAKGKTLTKVHVKELLELEKKFDVILIGNGIGNNKIFIDTYLKKSTARKVIDADALKYCSIQSITNSALTPHKKEFETLLKNSNTTEDKIQEILENNIILLKGKSDKIITKESTFYNKTGNSYMTKAGTGDVLAGMLAGFYSQNNDALMSSKLAAYYLGKTAEKLAKKGHFLTSDLANKIQL